MNYEAEELLQSISRHGKKVKGIAELQKHLKGERLTRGKAIMAKCYECMGYYMDGRQDCKCVTCPLYPYNPLADSK